MDCQFIQLWVWAKLISNHCNKYSSKHMKLKQYFKVLIRNPFKLRNVKDITFLTYQVQRYNMYTIYHLVLTNRKSLICLSQTWLVAKMKLKDYLDLARKTKYPPQNSYPTHTATRILHLKHCHFGQSPCLIHFTPTHEASASTLPVKKLQHLSCNRIAWVSRTGKASVKDKM